MRSLMKVSMFVLFEYRLPQVRTNRSWCNIVASWNRSNSPRRSLCSGANADAALAAGADKVGFEDLAEAMKGGDLNYHVVIASPVP